MKRVLLLALMTACVLFFSCIKKIYLPALSTDEASLITKTSAVTGGNVYDNGGSTVLERGIYYGTSENPELNGSRVQSGSGTGTYSITITGLTAGTKYYVKAYAINGKGIAYGDQVSFTTSAETFILTEEFTGTTLSSIWDIFDNTAVHEAGINLEVNNQLIITRGATNNNNGHYGIISKSQYENVKEATIDVWLSALHNWQDVKGIFHTPIGAIFYYNYEGKWGCQYTSSAGVFKYLYLQSGYTPDIKYALRIRISNNTLYFEMDSGSGYVQMFSTTDFSPNYVANGMTLANKKVMLINSDRGYVKYDNLILK